MPEEVDGAYTAAFEAAKALLEKSQRILVSGHLSPDGDSIGAMIAVERMLKAAGKDAVASADLKSLGKMSFLQAAKDIVPLKRIKRKRFDLLFVVDCAALDRLPVEIRPFAQRIPVLAIDHHRTNTDFGTVSVVDPDASSACQLVWQFSKFMGWEFDSAVAESLWTGMVTDSGKFSYQSTSPQTLRAAADVLSHGVNTARINDIIFGTFSAKAIKLKRILWRSLHIWKNHKVAEVSLSRDDFRSVRGTKADAEDGVEIPRSVMRNEIALYFYQIPDRTQETRVSIRTREPWDATVLAGRFGGGGHLRAAGCTIKGTMNEAKRLMRKAVKEMLAQGKNPAVKAAKAAEQQPAQTPPPAPAPVPVPAPKEEKVSGGEQQ